MKNFSKFIDFNLISIIFFSVLTNAQSKGIVKRLISYHEESQNDNNRNRYVYNRFGDFPIVHLKKTELKRNIVRSSSVRIAPPSKLNFNREARAAILRTNSFQIGQFGLNSSANKLSPVRMKAQDKSHQIITNHEPILLEEQPQTSKSVLEALEKNCRKRINLEELTMDRQKRICPPTIQQELEVPSNNINSNVVQSGKRARASPEKSVTDSGISQQVKRFRIKNNAILSSLSSSHHELIPKQNKNVLKTLSNRNPVPHSVENKSTNQPKPQLDPMKSQQSLTPVKPKLRLFNVDATQPPPNFRSKNRHSFRDDDDDEDEVKINFVKPKDKPSNINFDANQQVEKEKLSRMLHVIGDGLTRTRSEYTRDTVDAKKPEEVPKSSASISFTTSTTTTVSSAPISSPSSSASDTNSTIPKLSFTSSSIVNPTESLKVPEKPTTESKTEESSKPEEPKTSTASSLPSILSVNSENKDNSTEKSKAVTFGSFNFTATTSANSTFSILSPSKPSLPSIDSNKASLISFSPAPTQKTDSPTTKPAANIPVLGGFSFTSPTNKESDKSSTPSFSFGAPKTTIPTTSIESSVSTSSTTQASSISFGAIAATSTNSIPSVSVNPGTFSFGTNNSSTTTSAPSALPSISFNKAPTTQSSGVGFSFGGSTAAPVSTSSNTGFSFGSTTSKPTAAVGGFSFSATQNKAETPKFEGFGQTQSSATTTQANPIGVFQSPSSAANTTGTKPENIFSRLGGKPNETTTSTFIGFGGLEKKSPISFGMDNKQTEVTPSFNFGADKKNDAPPSFGSIQNSNETNNQISTFSFGQKQAENKATFSFGGDKSSESKTAFSFSGNQEKKDPPPAFNFGGNSQKQDAPPAFNFGAAKPQEASKISFGIDNKTELPKPTFGATNNNTTSGSGIFGAAIKPFSSKPDPTPTFGQNVVPSFGQSTPSFNTGNVNPVFGSNNNQQNPPAFGTATSSMFGNSNNNTSTFNQPQNAFGNSQQNSTSAGGMFSFGQTNKPAQTPQPNQPNGSVFSFGTSNTSQPTPQANIFGSGSSEQNVSASFTFKPSTGIATANNTGGIFNSNQNSQQNAFQFGQGVTNASASFTFSPSSATTANSQPPAFNFNGPQTAPAMPTGAFNFQAQQQQQPQMHGGQNNTGFFSIGVGGGQQKRPYRQATRRLK
jgi:nuclear pore complex protein Nup121